MLNGIKILIIQKSSIIHLVELFFIINTFKMLLFVDINCLQIIQRLSASPDSYRDAGYKNKKQH
jgi:hypothetical protein